VLRRIGAKSHCNCSQTGRPSPFYPNSPFLLIEAIKVRIEL
jgi:hypothetical protein